MILNYVIIFVLLVYMGAFQMHFIAISINHRTADVALREQVAFRDDALRIAHEDLYETKSILEMSYYQHVIEQKYTLLLIKFIQVAIMSNDFSSCIWI